MNSFQNTTIKFLSKNRFTKLNSLFFNKISKTNYKINLRNLDKKKRKNKIFLFL
jgi:hypothetical protein